MSPMSRGSLAAAVLVAALLAAQPAAAAPCPAAPDPSALPSAAALRQMHAFVDSLGVRPTGSPAQVRYIDWIRRQLATMPGISVSELRFPIDRWTTTGATLRLRTATGVRALPIAGAIPYSAATGRRGVAAPLVVVPDNQKITANAAAGKIVVRQANPGGIAQADLLLPIVSWSTYDPKHTIDPLGTFQGDFVFYNARMTDLQDAAAAGAKGLLFVKNLPRRQLIGHYEPYDGVAWGVPGAFLGADEGKQITDALAAGGAPTARITIRAHFKRVVTPSILATLPGRSPQRIVIDSHTDGTNAVEDNGPVAMVAIARYYAGLPLACRPRTLEFAFSTAHFYQRVAAPSVRDGGAAQLAGQLDHEYDKGTVSAVLVLEHLGAVDDESVPRTDGPGDVLTPTGQRAIQFVAVTPSVPLLGAVDSVIRRYDLQRTITLQGSDPPGNHVPSHCSFGGEGTPFNYHLLPTIGVIAAPQFLYDPAFGLESIDFDVMHAELLAYTDLLGRMGATSQSAIAGLVTLERTQRRLGAATCPGVPAY
jgi:hypothetical protein